ncbi:MAG: glycine--tRNA ligase subunit beta [Nitrospirae bacterium]|jgi:glycyl-tRNA synthetase beta chain|nr:glycine--tRNA ligase subunit beta [Nitrospirota bacterium]
MSESVNQKSSFLLEIGTEDLPARFITPALQQLKENTGAILKESYIKFNDIKTYGTPRRLAVIADGIPPVQEDRVREVFGPSRKAAFDENGRPAKAARGFANSLGVNVEDLIIKSKDRGEYVVAVVEEKGLNVREILPEIFKKIVLSLHLPKAMRWGNSNVRFVRPIRWITSLFDKEVIFFEIDGIKSSNMTMGHRFLSPAAFQIKEIPSYKKLLANNYVIVSQEERKRVITEKMEGLLSACNERPVDDPELLETVINLVEYPVPVLANFSEEYLELPEELLITVMKDHQKYFAAEDKEGRITGRFIVVSNTGEEISDTVRIGAERVIKARFEDARFYYEEDIKKPLSARIEELKKVIFQERLGSLYDKTERLVSIADFLGDKILPSLKQKLARVAWLSKTDLITGVVREFPELQGVIGKYYAIHNGEDREVAEAIEDQYLPPHSGGRLPRTDTGALLSIADKIDNIASFFAIGLTPTGSEDPFALRRQVLGIIAIIMDKGYEVILKELIDKALENLSHIEGSKESRENILRFFGNRLETFFSDQQYRPELIQSIISLSTDIQLKEIKERLDAIQKFMGKKEFGDFLTAIKRVHNIIPKTPISGLKEELLMEDAEKSLKEKLDYIRSELTALLTSRRFYDALALLSSLTEPVNKFFDQVLVMDKRAEIKNNRLALLNEIWRTVSKIADFSKLAVAQG